MRLVIPLLLVASLGLASCETLSASLPPRPCRPDVATGVKPEPQVPDGAGIPAPVTPEEVTATDSYLTWLAEFGAWAREGNRKAALAATDCKKAPA